MLNPTEFRAQPLVSITRRRKHIAALLASLSVRELEVFRRLAAGESVGDMARSNSITYSSARKYRQRLLAKLGIHSTAEIIQIATALRMVKTPRLPT